MLDDLIEQGLGKRVEGDLDGAMADFTRAIEIDSKYKSIYYSCRGIAKADKGDLRDAIADFTKTIEMDPKEAPTQ